MKASLKFGKGGENYIRCKTTSFIWTAQVEIYIKKHPTIYCSEGSQAAPACPYNKGWLLSRVEHWTVKKVRWLEEDCWEYAAEDRRWAPGRKVVFEGLHYHKVLKTLGGNFEVKAGMGWRVNATPRPLYPQE